MRVLLATCCACAAVLIAPVGAGASAAPEVASASKATCKTKQQKQSRACRLIAKPTPKAPWKYRDPKLPLTASYDGTKLKVVATEEGACEEAEFQFARVSYPINASIPVNKGAFNSDVTVTGSNGKRQIILLRGELTKDALSITITASFDDASSCIIGGNKNSVKRKL